MALQLRASNFLNTEWSRIMRHRSWNDFLYMEISQKLNDDLIKEMGSGARNFQNGRLRIANGYVIVPPNSSTTEYIIYNWYFKNDDYPLEDVVFDYI